MSQSRRRWRVWGGAMLRKWKRRTREARFDDQVEVEVFEVVVAVVAAVAGID